MSYAHVEYVTVANLHLLFPLCCCFFVIVLYLENVVFGRALCLGDRGLALDNPTRLSLLVLPVAFMAGLCFSSFERLGLLASV